MPSNTPPSERRGILGAGNWIIDHVKLITSWPPEETLATIVSEELGTGGSPYNVLVDLARFDLGIPLHGLGLVGDDEDGHRILQDCDRWGIDRRFLKTTSRARTAYTDVMSVISTGRRTFFHHRGASALLSPGDFPVEQFACRIANLAYLLLLDGLDAPDPEYGTGAARVLARLRTAGILTSIDVVSEDSDRFRRIVTPSLRHADFCIINEIEAGGVTGLKLREEGRLVKDRVEKAAAELLRLGVNRLAVIHAPEGAYGAERGGRRHWQPAHQLSPAEIKGTAGAGDAFLAGMLVGLHEGWELPRSMRFAHAAAVSCLSYPTTTGGVCSAREIERIMETVLLQRDF
ncbi:MAG: carbohydrate kinase family protein [Planctomycetes bacterium]|nr:carbohydrate kinase family protein [Planctomycetota bacterium]